MLKPFFFLLILFLNLPCLADSQEEELQHPFFLSLSGSGGASLNENFSYLINPSLLAFHKRKKIGLSYSFKNKYQTAVFSIVDNKVKLPVALTYQRWWSDSFRKGTENKFLLSSGFKLYKFLSLGFNIEKSLESHFPGNASIGSFIKLSPHFGIALFLDKVFKEKNKNRRLLTLSSSYQWKKFFSIQSDLSKSAEKKWLLKGGFESFFHPLFSFQVGGMAFMSELDFQEVEKYLLSGGLSFHSPKFVCQYGLQTNSKDYQHSFTFLMKL